ncbi:MAG: hypothetical protein Q9200_000793 [Gallowayella weberi]
MQAVNLQQLREERDRHKRSNKQVQQSPSSGRTLDDSGIASSLSATFSYYLPSVPGLEISIRHNRSNVERRDILQSPSPRRRLDPPPVSTPDIKETGAWENVFTNKSLIEMSDAAKSKKRSDDGRFKQSLVGLGHLLLLPAVGAWLAEQHNKVENYGYVSSSSPSGHDPREEVPVTDEEVAELQVALWPSIQQLVELTKRYPLDSEQQETTRHSAKSITS